MRTIPSSKALSIFNLFIAMTSIQVGAALAKQLFPKVGSAGAACLRTAIAAGILCIAWRPWRKKLNRFEMKLIGKYGIALGFMNLFFYLAIDRIPLGVAVAIEFLGPLSIALLASRKPLDFIWAALAAAGILLILPLTDFSQPLDPIGLLFIFLAAFAWALYIHFGQKAGSAIASGSVTSWGMLIAALVTLPFGLIHAKGALLDPSLIPVALGVAIFSSALPYTLEMSALKSISAQNFGILMSVEPALAALSGLFFLNEHLTGIQWIAILFVMTASFGTSISSKSVHP